MAADIAILGNTGAVLNNVYVYTVYSIILFSVILIGAFFMWSKSFNIETVIYEQMGNGIKIVKKKSKKVEKIGGNKLKFFMSKMVMALPSGNFFFPKGKNSYMLSLYKDKNGNLNPVELRFDENKNPLYIPDDSDKRFWFVNHMKEAEEAYKKGDKWTKFAPMIIIGSVIAFALIIMIVYGKFYFDGIKEISSPLNSQLGDLNTGVRVLNNALSAVTEVKTPLVGVVPQPVIPTPIPSGVG